MSKELSKIRALIYIIYYIGAFVLIFFSLPVKSEWEKGYWVNIVSILAIVFATHYALEEFGLKGYAAVLIGFGGILIFITPLSSILLMILGVIIIIDCYLQDKKSNKYLDKI